MKTEILLQCNNEDLPFYEKQMIKAYDTFGPNGYNQTSGGEIGKEYTQEIRQKISDKLKEGWENGTITNKVLTNEELKKRQENANGTVYFRKQRSKFAAIIPESWSSNKKQRSIGLFETKEEAENALTVCKQKVLNGELYSFDTKKKVHGDDVKKRISKSRQPKGEIIKRGNQYWARIPKWWSDTGQRKYIGKFDTEEEAMCEINKWRK